MSAFIVPKAHITVLVQALINERLISPADATTIGTTLWAENHKGVNVRYGERRGPPRYTFTSIEAPLEDAVVLEAAHCLDYQAAEFDGYEQQPGMRLLAELIDTMRARLRLTGDTEHAWCDQRGEELGRHLWVVDTIEDAIRADAMGVQPPRECFLAQHYQEATEDPT